MKYLVDANVFSEVRKKKPNPGVVGWLQENWANCYTSAHVIAELAAWIHTKEGKDRESWQAWFTGFLESMEGRILAFNTSVAVVWAQQEAAQRNRPLPMPDSFIAATARRYQLTIVTRNTRDFPSVKTVNPWELPAS